jgi:HK97 gp10 family phage protein
MAREAIRIEGLEGVMKTLRALPKEMVSKNGGPVLFALRKGGKVLAEQMKANLRRIILEPNLDGKPSESTGLLEKNVAVKRGGKPKGQNGERVIVGFRRKSYPANRGKNVSTPQVARLLEYGDEKKRAHPFIRPAFDAKKTEAVDTFTREIRARLDKFVKKVARQNGAKL